MSKQVSLFGEPTKEETVVITTKKKPRKQEEQEDDGEDYHDIPEPSEEKETEEKPFNVEEEIKDDKYGWTQLPKDRRGDIGFAFVNLQLLSRTDLNGTRYGVTASVEHQHPRGMLGSMYGSGDETFRLNNLEEIQKYFANLMELKKSYLQEAYREFTDRETEISYQHHYIYYDFRLIPAKNFFVVISDKLVELITKTGFDFEKWYKEYRDLPENPATDEHWAKAHENLKLMEQGDEITKKLEAIDTILKTNQNLRDTMDFFTKTKEEVIKEFKDLPLKLREISDKIKENERSIGKERYSTPFSWELEHFTGEIPQVKKKKLAIK